MNWYYAEDGAQKGPVSEEQFQALVQAGTIQPDTLVWREGMPDWKTYEEVTAPPPVASVEQETTAPEVADTTTAEPADLSENFDPGAFLDALRNRGRYSIDIGGAISRGWDVLAANFFPAVGVCLLIMIIQVVVSLIPFLGNFASLFLGGPFSGGLIYYFLLHVRDQPATLESAFAGFVQPRFLKLMLTGVIMGVIQGLVVLLLLVPVFIAVPGLAALGTNSDSVAAFSPLLVMWVFIAMIPVLFLSVIWCLTYMVVVDTGLSYWEAMEFSRKVVMMRFWSWLLFLIVCAFLLLAGTMVFCVGLLIAMPVVIAAYAKVWDDIVTTVRSSG